MIEEVLKNVKNAEAEAEKIIAAAEERAAEIKLSADNACAEILDKAKKESRAQSAITVKNAEIEADKAFNDAAKACEDDCERLKADTVGKVEKLAEEVFGRIVG